MPPTLTEDMNEIHDKNRRRDGRIPAHLRQRIGFT
jgi:hypothetical protein